MTPTPPELLDEKTVQQQLGTLPGWSGSARGIERTFTAPEFLAGIDLVTVVAAAAEELDHHPDIDIRWRSVTFRLSTHSVGGVTNLDLDLARRISGLAASRNID